MGSAVSGWGVGGELQTQALIPTNRPVTRPAGPNPPTANNGRLHTSNVTSSILSTILGTVLEDRCLGLGCKLDLLYEIVLEVHVELDEFEVTAVFLTGLDSVLPDLHS